MTSLTLARLVAIERALRFRLTTPHPPIRDNIESYERALDWAKEQKAKRSPETHPAPTAAIPPPLKKRA